MASLSFCLTTAAPACAVAHAVTLSSHGLRTCRPIVLRSKARYTGPTLSRSLRVDCAAATGETLEKVRGIIASQLAVGADKVTAEAKFADLGADSLDTVEIMMALEEQFDLTLDEEGAEKITTVQEAADLIQSKL